MKVIELQPLADVDPDVLESLVPSLQQTFGVTVRVNPDHIPIDRFYDRQRGQYNSTEILHYLDDHLIPTIHEGKGRPVRSVRRVGVTRFDLFIPILTYVFGEAALGGNVAVVSYHRFRNELYGLPPDRRLVEERLHKVAVHELGHSLGLTHCTLQECVMHAASYVEELDLKGSAFCRSCREAIEHPKLLPYQHR